MGFRYREQLPDDFKVFADKARKMGYRLIGTASDAERYRMTLPHDGRILATFSDLAAVRDWLAD
ncbi:hypothetical protein ACFCQI_14250 [Rhodanobacter sp. FW102-FHT14D06]|uniref:Uncharacterized protein n=2 Tax=unclassified Rhodanobacter TaxID=2621553 RepID=A0AB74V0Q2_9GAMM